MSKDRYGADLYLEGLEGQSPNQLLLRFIARTWGCGLQVKKDHHSVSKENLWRDKVFENLEIMVQNEWNCQTH